jgi:Uma2 family endonuclease
VKERTLGTWSHGFLQGFLAAFFNRNWRAWQVLAGIQIRVRVSATRVRIPDVCVMRRSDPADPVVLAAPLICVEVLSPEDTLRSNATASTTTSPWASNRSGL